MTLVVNGVAEGGGSVTAAGIVAAVADPGDAADVLDALTPATAVSLASSSGWTARGGAGSGTATVNTGAGKLDLSCVAGSSEVFAAIGHAPWSAEPVVDLRARLSAWSGDASTAHYALMQVADALAATVSLGVQVFGDSTVKAIAYYSGGSHNGAAVSVPSILGGQGWVRLVLRGGTARCYAGVGSGGAEPTSWTDLGEVAAPVPVAPWALVVAQAGRASGGNVSASWTSLRYRTAAL